jgi:Na+-driven multidrug efflux pump
VPLALTGAFVLRLPVYYVYLLVMVEEALKFVVSIFRYRSKRWIHNLVTT